MNTVEISVFGTSEPHISCVTVEDQYANDLYHIETVDVDRARAEGVPQLLALVLENATAGARDIISAARENVSPVYLNGDEIDHGIFDQAPSQSL
ncbi:hypothetical protein G6L37_34905 [Agrobacterium rubi]|nr:hypothetical protein [Agrobacterium rubi]NTF23759.1 hypothetical protein [Agrobacterium rubi]